MVTHQSAAGLSCARLSQYGDGQETMQYCTMMCAWGEFMEMTCYSHGHDHLALPPSAYIVSRWQYECHVESSLVSWNQNQTYQNQTVSESDS